MSCGNEQHFVRDRYLQVDALVRSAVGSFLPSKFVEQRPGLLQNGRIEALSEPAVGRCEEIAGAIALTLLAPDPGETDRGDSMSA
jgi:hypothetical protein